MVQDAPYVAAQIIAAIEEVGPESVVQVVMDGAAVCIAAGDLITDRQVLCTHRAYAMLDCAESTLLSLCCP